MLSPETFADIFARRLVDPQVSQLLLPDGPLFACCESNHHFSFDKRVWIIDGDDTLWEDNVHYESLASDFAAYVVSSVGADLIGAAEIRKILDDVEHEIIPIHGFGPVGFDLSIRECFCRLQKRFGTGLNQPTAIFDRVLPLLSGVPYDVDPTIALVLRELRNRGDGLVLFTQGPCEIQQGKIARSGLSSAFHGLAVGSNKAPGAYQELLSRLGIRVEQAIIVGNSLRSEIQPALDIGARAVHYLNPNSWHAVNKTSIPRDRYSEVTNLSELSALQI